MHRPAHGGLDVKELDALGLTEGEVLDFSASVNPLGPSPRVLRALADADPAAYPDRDCTRLREALAAGHGVSSSKVLVGNGSTELIHLAARALLGQGETAMVFAPTFGEYKAACTLAGARVEQVLAREESGFHWDTQAAVEAVRRCSPRLVFLCNPNNPTGVCLDEGSVCAIADAVGSDGLLAVDQAYLPFVEEGWDSRPLLERQNVLLLRSMTKDHALAGLRIGYLMASEAVVERLSVYQPSWSVNTYAQAAALAALEDAEHVERAKVVIRGSKTYLMEALEAIDVPVLPSAANFLLAKVGDGASLRLTLLKRGFCVRDCASFGLPEYIRIGVRMEEDCRRLVAAMRKEFPHG